MEEKLKETMSRLFKIDVDSITDKMTMQDVERWDSLKHLEFVMKLEEVFDIAFETEEIIELVSVEEIKKTLIKKGVS
ncbi:acyl carrier protein [Calditrichota bacterium]